MRTTGAGLQILRFLAVIHHLILRAEEILEARGSVLLDCVDRNTHQCLSRAQGSANLILMFKWTNAAVYVLTQH